MDFPHLGNSNLGQLSVVLTYAPEIAGSSILAIANSVGAGAAIP